MKYHILNNKSQPSNYKQNNPLQTHFRSGSGLQLGIILTKRWKDFKGAGGGSWWLLVDGCSGMQNGQGNSGSELTSVKRRIIVANMRLSFLLHGPACSRQAHGRVMVNRAASFLTLKPTARATKIRMPSYHH
jgi:hypothetical protein